MKPEPEHPLAAPASGLTHPWPEPPEGGTSILVAPGIRWIRMPLPFQLNHINLWLLDDESGVTVVDTGIGLPPTRELFRTMWEVDRGWMPDIRSMCAEAELEGKAVTRLGREEPSSTVT